MTDQQNKCKPLVPGSSRCVQQRRLYNLECSLWVRTASRGATAPAAAQADTPVSGDIRCGALEVQLSTHSPILPATSVDRQRIQRCLPVLCFGARCFLSSLTVITPHNLVKRTVFDYQPALNGKDYIEEPWP